MLEANNFDDIDVAIVGSGVAGALIADKLSAKGLKVLVLEAGGKKTRAEIYKDATTLHSGMAANTPYPSTKLAPMPTADKSYQIQAGADAFHTNYLRVVGGTTWHWGAVTMRLLENDFNLKNTYGVGKNWPINKSEIEPYYQKAEKELSINGVVGDKYNEKAEKSTYPQQPQQPSYLDKYIQQKAGEIGLEFSQIAMARNTSEASGRPACEGFGSCTPICPIGAQYSASHHVQKATNNGAIIIANALATKLETDSQNNIKSLTYKTPEGALKKVAAKIFVVAANTIESAKIMLLSSNLQNPNGLANSSNQVGRNLMSHLGFNTRMLLPDQVYGGRGPRNGVAIQNFRDGKHRKNYGAYYLQVTNIVDVQGRASKLLKQGLLGDELNNKLKNLVSRELNIFARVEQLPSPNNRLELDYRAGFPKVKITYQIDEYAKAGLAQAKAQLKKLTNHLNAEEIEFIGENSTSHPLGTLCMGADAKSSVVDANCKTHDHKNLFIASGAVFTTGSVSTPTLTIAALSLRIADKILQDLS